MTILLALMFNTTSCYVKDEFVMANKPFYWFELPLYANQTPKALLVYFNGEKMVKSEFVEIRITDETVGKDYIFKPDIQDGFRFRNDSLIVTLNHKYKLRINANGHIYEDSAFVFQTKANLKIELNALHENEFVLEGKITNDEDAIFIYSDLTLYRDISNFNYLGQVSSKAKIRFNYICGPPNNGVTFSKHLLYADGLNYNKLERAKLAKSLFNGNAFLSAPGNYEDYILNKGISGFFGYIGVINSNKLENLDDSKIIKTLRIIDETDNRDITNSVEQLEINLIKDDIISDKSFSTRENTVELFDIKEVTENAFKKLDLMEGEHPYSCKVYNANRQLQTGVLVTCKINGVHYFGFAIFKDNTSVETIKIRVKNK